MWARNLLFVGLVLAAGVGLKAALFPPPDPGRSIRLDPSPAADDDFRSTVRQVDEAFRADWAAKGLTPAPRADDLTVARRLSLALTGTVPSLEEIRAFEAADPADRADGWVGHLLSDRRFGNYFADRLSRAYVGTEDGPLIAYRKRRFKSWLSDELMANTPYGHLVREMIAGTGLNTDRPGVNFIAAQYEEERNGPDPEKLTVRVTRAFLGLRIDCAQCHDHFLEPTWKQTDFQALAAFFGQTRHVVTHVSDGDGEYRYEDKQTGTSKAIAPAVPFLPELLPADGTRRERLARWVTDPRNVHFARATVNRVWAMLFNRPLRKRVEAQTLDEEAHPALDVLAADFAAHGHDLHRLVRLIAAAEAFRLSSAAPHELTEEHEKAWASFPVTRLRPEQVIGGVLQAANVRTADGRSHAFLRVVRYLQEQDFVTRYGDPEDDDFGTTDGTIPQRLLMMNGELVNEKAREELLNASSLIAMFAPDDRSAVEVAYLTVLTRRPTPGEWEHFAAKLAGTTGDERKRRLADLFWVLFNSTEFSWLS